MHATLRLIALWALAGQTLATPIARSSNISEYNQTLYEHDIVLGGLPYDGDEDVERSDYRGELGDGYDYDNGDEDDEDDEYPAGDFEDPIASNRSVVYANRLDTRARNKQKGPPQVDCEGNAGPTCSTMCFAALCHDDATGVHLDGGRQTSPLKHRPGGADATEHAVRVDVAKWPKAPKLPSIQTVGIRTLAGTSNWKATKSLMEQAGLIVDGEDGHGNKYSRKVNIKEDEVSPDEWPPASSDQGGLQSVVHMVPRYAQKAQSGLVSAMWDHGGFMKVTNWKKNRLCVAFDQQDKSECKSNKAFGSIDYQVPKGNNKFHQAGSLPASAPNNRKMAELVKEAEGRGATAKKPKKPKTGATAGTGGSGNKRPHPNTGNSQAHVPTRPKTNQQQGQTSGGQGHSTSGQGHSSGQGHASGGQGNTSGGHAGGSGSGKKPNKSGH